MARVDESKLSVISRAFAIVFLIWTASLVLVGVLTISREKDKCLTLTLDNARSFFQMIATARYWNALHGGVYVPVTKDTLPNPFLDVPHRDVLTNDGRELTLINPAYMTRQLADIAAKRNNVRFHITSLRPIRPENAPDNWEVVALRSFSRTGDEYYELVNTKDAEPHFRYMAPLWAESPCLKCHGKQDYKEGDLRGGVSVVIPAATIVSASRTTITTLGAGFLGIWLLGILGILISYLMIRKESRQRLYLVHRLRRSLEEIRTLKGFIPICSSCKKVRNDAGYWEQIEKYIKDRSEAEFTHSICPHCLKKLYPDFAKEEAPVHR